MRLLKVLKDRVLLYLEAQLAGMKSEESATGAFLTLATSIDTGLMSRVLSADYIETVEDSDTVSDISADAYARHNHLHPQYLRLENADTATGFDTGEAPSDIAYAPHFHDNYYRKGFKVDTARRLTGRIPQLLAPVEHEHPNYIPRDEIVDRAYRIDGVTAEELAPADHEHTEYYGRTETVTSADSFIAADGLVLPIEALALAEHEHPDQYYNKKEATGLFVHDQIFGNTEELEMVTIRVPSVELGGMGASVAPGSADYSYLQAPHGLTGFSSSAVLTLPVASSAARTTNYVCAELHDLWVTPGSFVTISLPSVIMEGPSGGTVLMTPTIQGVIPSVEVLGASGAVEGKSEWVSIYFSGSSFSVRAFNFQDAISALKVRALVLYSRNFV